MYAKDIAIPPKFNYPYQKPENRSDSAYQLLKDKRPETKPLSNELIQEIERIAKDVVK